MNSIVMSGTQQVQKAEPLGKTRGGSGKDVDAAAAGMFAVLLQQATAQAAPGGPVDGAAADAAADAGQADATPVGGQDQGAGGSPLTNPGAASNPADAAQAPQPAQAQGTGTAQPRAQAAAGAAGGQSPADAVVNAAEGAGATFQEVLAAGLPVAPDARAAGASGQAVGQANTVGLAGQGEAQPAVPANPAQAAQVPAAQAPVAQAPTAGRPTAQGALVAQGAPQQAAAQASGGAAAGGQMAAAGNQAPPAQGQTQVAGVAEAVQQTQAMQQTQATDQTQAAAQQAVAGDGTAKAAPARGEASPGHPPGAGVVRQDGAGIRAAAMGGQSRTAGDQSGQGGQGAQSGQAGQSGPAASRTRQVPGEAEHGRLPFDPEQAKTPEGVAGSGSAEGQFHALPAGLVQGQTPVQGGLAPQRAAEATAMATPAPDPKDILNQVISRVKVSIEPGRTEARIHLVPEQLGPLDLKVSLEGGQLTARFHVVSSQVKEILEQHLPELRQALQEQGIRVEQFSVSLGSGQTPQGSGQEGQAQAWQNRGGHHGRYGTGSFSGAEVGRLPEAAAATGRGLHQLDLIA